MRKLKRSIARAYMMKKGIERMNKKHFDAKTRLSKSAFAENWRKYLKLALEAQ